MQLTSLIIDDEPLARQRLKNLLDDVSQIKLLGECRNGKEAIEKINNLKPDLIFLDIQLKDLTGFEVLEGLESNTKPIIIFVTAYDEFALKAFEFFAFDYLLKPFKDDRFYRTMDNVIEYFHKGNLETFEVKINNLLEHINLNGNTPIKINHKKIPIKLGNKISFIDSSNVKYITASGYYAEIHTNDKKHLLRESLNRLNSELNPNDFFRIHRSTIINLNYISELINSNYGEIDVKMTDNKLFRISKSYKKEFTNRMGL